MVTAPENSHVVHSEYDVVFLHDQEVQKDDLRRLYENAKRDQWNASTYIDWAKPVDLEQGFVADELIDIYDSPYWHKMNARERQEMNRLFSAWRLSQLFHGEHAAVLVCSQLANVLPDSDTKFFMSTQVMDEARHTEFFQRYLHGQGGPGLRPIRRGPRAVRLHPERPSLVHQGHRPSAGWRNLRRGPVQDAGGDRKGRPAARGLQAHPARRVPPHGVRHAQPAGAGPATLAQRTRGDGGLHYPLPAQHPDRRASRRKPTSTWASTTTRSTTYARCAATGPRAATSSCSGSSSSTRCTTRW